MSSTQLVFRPAVRGAPSLNRGWRTPDPSPTRGCAGLPGCSHGAGEWVEETSEPGLALPSPKCSLAHAGTAAVESFEDTSTPRGHNLAWRAEDVPSEGLGDRCCTPAAVAADWRGITTVPSTTSTQRRGLACSTPTEHTAERPCSVTDARRGELQVDSAIQRPDPAARRPRSAASSGMPPVVRAPGVWLPPICAPRPAPADLHSACAVAVCTRGAASAAAPMRALPRPLPPAPSFDLDSGTTAQQAAELGAEPEAAPCPSIGSSGHPCTCAEACKFVWKRRGCKEGAACDRCHLCVWRKPGPRRADESKPAKASVLKKSSTVSP